MNLHTAVPDMLSELIQVLTNSEHEQISLSCKEDLFEMYLVIGALLQLKYQYKINKVL